MSASVIRNTTGAAIFTGQLLGGVAVPIIRTALGSIATDSAQAVSKYVASSAASAANQVGRYIASGSKRLIHPFASPAKRFKASSSQAVVPYNGKRRSFVVVGQRARPRVSRFRSFRRRRFARRF